MFLILILIINAILAWALRKENYKVLIALATIADLCIIIANAMPPVRYF
jgi:hypothetical protein